MGITITEALAEIKTIGKRIDSKRRSIENYLARQEFVRDPLDKDGGSASFIARERQGIVDLETRLVSLRKAIRLANESTEISIDGETRSIADWLTFRREVAPGRQVNLSGLRSKINSIRENSKRQGVAVIADANAAKQGDVIVNISEAELSADTEHLENVLGQLDGLLSLKNATTSIVE
jgi:hypothetical protein